jgi:MFS transporter, PPP family, 3-phenylpropionic acid transporter
MARMTRAGLNQVLILRLVFFYLPAGVLLSYLSPYLSGRGLSLTQVGVIVAALFAIKLFAGPLTVLYADRSSRHVVISALFTCVAVAASIAITASRNFVVLLFGVLALSLARNYFQSVLESSTALFGTGGRITYSRMRLVGSLAVAVGVGFVGAATTLDVHGVNAFALVLCVSAFGCFAVAIVPIDPARLEPAAPQADQQVAPTAVARVRLPANLVTLLVVGVLMIGSNGAMYSVAGVALQRAGHSPGFIVACWLVAFTAEAVGFFIFDRALAMFGGHLALLIGVIACVRWVILAESIWSAPLVLLAFAAQIGTFAWVHSGLVLAVCNIFGSKYAATGQAVYVAAAHGIGISAVSAVSARLFEYSGPHAFYLPLVLSLCGAALLSRIRIRRESELVSV